MTTIKTSKVTELTPEQIASMSEMIAKYMGWEVLGSYDKITHKRKSIIRVNIYGYWEEYNSIDADWNVLHEVWDKVSSEDIDGMNQYWYQIELALCGNEKQETFWALHRAIIYINQLKKTENGKESI